MAYDPRQDTMEFLQHVRKLEASQQQKYITPAQAGFPAVSRTQAQRTGPLIVVERRKIGESDWQPFHSTHSSKDANKILQTESDVFEYRLRE